MAARVHVGLIWGVGFGWRGSGESKVTSRGIIVADVGRISRLDLGFYAIISRIFSMNSQKIWPAFCFSGATVRRAHAASIFLLNPSNPSNPSNHEFQDPDFARDRPGFGP